MRTYESLLQNHVFLVNDATLASDNLSRFRKNLLEGIENLIMTVDDKIKEEILQYDIKREVGNYQHDRLKKMINMNILQVNKY